MRTKHRKTLSRIFATPTPVDIRWDEIDALLRAAGVDIVERSGSRMGLVKGGERIVIHRPHPKPVVGQATVRDIKAFLRAIGVQP